MPSLSLYSISLSVGQHLPTRLVCLTNSGSVRVSSRRANLRRVRQHFLNSSRKAKPKSVLLRSARFLRRLALTWSGLCLLTSRASRSLRRPCRQMRKNQRRRRLSLSFSPQLRPLRFLNRRAWSRADEGPEDRSGVKSVGLHRPHTSNDVRCSPFANGFLRLSETTRWATTGPMHRRGNGDDRSALDALSRVRARGRIVGAAHRIVEPHD